MVFSNLFFLYFFLFIFLLCYYAVPGIKSKNALLVVFSLIFYAWGEPVYVLLLIASTILNYISGLVISKFRDRVPSKAAFAMSLVINIGMLMVFKYSAFIITNINTWFSLDIHVPDISLPIGISFYTFQAMSYTIDCYWDTVKVQKNYFKFLMYVSLFPQLVAGPIVRYSDIENEISSRTISHADISTGITRITIGLAKKAIIANNLYTVVKSFFSNDISSVSVAGTWYAVTMYALYVYFDFSGYSDMAIGLGNLLGFHFNENFNYPFICKDVTEFWQRWHISLSTFFRDYLLYIPIFGKRRQTLNLFIVWFCTGLWHGASWNFVFWGLYFGIFIFIEQLIGKKRIKKIPLVIRHIYNKLVIIVGFGIFYFEDLGSLGNFFKNLIGLNNNALIDDHLRISITNNIFLIIAAIVASLPVSRLFRADNNSSPFRLCLIGTAKIAFTLTIFIISSILLVDATNNPFLYFRF
ncbi:MAG: MBOAT family O-acyltransferase [Oscillospiraceae bacterium]|nr:MBOAT family O-acyltransferase [Oscillospiraceae bacterium]